jgi:hypothetical protein
LTLYLTDFLNRPFLGENAKNRGLCGEKKMQAAAVDRPVINQAATPWKSTLCLPLILASTGAFGSSGGLEDRAD